MTWLTPALAGWVAAVAIPALLILYFLKLRRREVEVSTTLLWKKSIYDLQANAPFQKLRRNILLILQLIALAVAILALAQPERRAQLGKGGRTVLVIDRSASMGAIDDPSSRQSRLELAKEEARKYVEAMQEPGAFSKLAGQTADEAMIVAFDASAVVLQPFTASKPLLLAAIDAIQPTDAPTSVVEAFRLAGAHAKPVLVEDRGLVTTPGAPIHIWSDGSLPDASEISIQPETPVIFHRVGDTDAANIGVTALRAERAYDNPGRLSIFVGLRATDPDTRTADVELSINGLVAAIRPVAFPIVDPNSPGADGTNESGVVFTIDRSQGAIIGVRIVGEDALDSDDRAWLAVPPARRASVLLVTGGALYLQSALEGLNLASIRVASPAQAEALLRPRSGAGPEFDVVVLDNWAPADPLPPGRYLCLGALPRIAGVAPAPGEPASSGMLDYERNHPALRNALLDGLLVSRAVPAQTTDAARVLARGDRFPLMIEAFDGPVHALITTFDPADSNWPFDISFVLFLADAVAHLASDPTLEDQGLTPGSPIVATLPAGATNAEVIDPTGAPSRVEPAPDGRIVFGPSPRAGIYTVRWSGPAGPTDETISGRAQRPLAVNLLSAEESDIRARDALDLPTGAVAATGESAEAGALRLWPWLLLGALLVLLIEWWVYNRRVHL